jgi:flagellar biosynthesis/type III secretory pathway protein FliH
MCGDGKSDGCSEGRQKARTKIETLTDAVTQLTAEMKRMREDANRRDSTKRGNSYAVINKDDLTQKLDALQKSVTEVLVKLEAL